MIHYLYNQIIVALVIKLFKYMIRHDKVNKM